MTATSRIVIEGGNTGSVGRITCGTIFEESTNGIFRRRADVEGRRAGSLSKTLAFMDYGFLFSSFLFGVNLEYKVLTLHTRFIASKIVDVAGDTSKIGYESLLSLRQNYSTSVGEMVEEVRSIFRAMFKHRNVSNYARIPWKQW